MTDVRLDQLLTPRAPRTHAPAGRFVHRVPDDTWWWSDDLYRIYGFAPGEVVPSTELIKRHRHPDDPPSPGPAPADAPATAEPFCSQHRIVDARRRERALLTVGRAVTGPDGQVLEVRGYVVDLTSANRTAAQDEVDAAVAGVTVHRAAIEQAKGMLMVLRGLSGDAAFGVLRDYSQAHNVKLRDLAELLVETLRSAERPPSAAELDTLVARLGTASHNGGNGAHP